MLEIAVEGIALRTLRGVTVTFERSTHTALIGPPGCGISTLLRVIAGLERPDEGRVRIGPHDVTRMRPQQRPLLYATPQLDVPGRWSAEHALIQAARQRTLDRIDRRHEVMLAADKWAIDPKRRIDTLSDSERAALHLARIELLRPAVLVSDRLLRDLPSAAGEWYRTLRVIGTTIISAPATVAELGTTDSVVVIDQGSVLQVAPAAQVYRAPASEAAARATGEVTAIPAVMRGNEVDTPVGSWEIAAPPFQGPGLVLARPEAFTPAGRDEESDLIFGIEEASFADGRWLARGFITGGSMLTIALQADQPVYKGRVLAIKADPRAFTFVRK